MADQEQIFYEAHSVLVQAFLNKVPVVAVLGQSCGWSSQKMDPVFIQILKNLSKSGDGWSDILDRDLLDEHFYSWVAERFLRRSPSNLMLGIADAQLSAIYTSSVDPTLANMFATGGREPEPILVGTPPPTEIRSLRKPPIFYLFGRAGGGAAELDPPRNRQQLSLRRNKHASPMLLNLSESATTIGLIVIDGYHPKSDWLRAEDLLSTFANSPKGGVIWYGEEPEFKEDDDKDYYNELIESGVILRDSRSFSEVYTAAKTRGEIPDAQEWNEPEIVSLKSGVDFVVSPRLRLITEATASIIDNSWTGFLEPFTESEAKIAFQSFHGANIGARALIEGIRRNFTFERDFESNLFSKTLKALHRHHEQRGAIVVHGQSGVGKTIAMGRLALKIRNQEKCAVLMISGQRVPQPSEVAPFLEEVGRTGAVTLIAVDVNAPADRYDELLQALRSGGHKVVIVGTCYRLEARSSRFVFASDSLSEKEQELLNKISENYFPHIKGFDAGSDHALAKFYWSLPDSRAGIADGLSREVRLTETALRIRGEKPRARKNLSSLALQLIKRGYADPNYNYFDQSVDIEDLELNNPAAKVIDYVMAVSRLYKSVPINLLLRTVQAASGKSISSIDLDVVRDLFEGQDLFRWKYGGRDESELFVSARLQIEAELVCNRRIGSPEVESRYILELLSNAYRAGPDNSEESHFAIDIVYAMGNDGPAGDRYKDSWLEIARCLTELREKKGVYNARLMLQESVLRRAYLRTHESANDSAQKTIILAEATKAVNDTFSAIDAEGAEKLYAAKRTREFLYTERAATYGFLATDSASKESESDEVWASYTAAREAARVAIGRAFSYQPLDIALWVPIRVLKEASKLTDYQKAELQADIRATLDAVDPLTLNSTQKVLYERQKFFAGEVLNDDSMSDEAFEALHDNGSAAGYYLRARALAPSRPDKLSAVTEAEIEAASRTVEYLEDAKRKIALDTRSLQLLLSTHWLRATGNWIFRGFRQPLPSNLNDREKIRGLLAELEGAEGKNFTPQLRYLTAVFMWLCGDESEAIRSWRSLARDTEYIEAKRITNRHTITDDNGRPVAFSGHLVKSLAAGRWSVKVEGLNRTIDLQESDFNERDFALGKTVRQFAISFNYRGPIADASFWRKS
ncbi:ATP-binding protein [Phytopseudomonas dryadis]|uniref:ATP-binding protein n=1 Tax=Phytopseudomonas dryadis TaxID=2487520 RepID=UPI00103843EB|nr:ATP-binding protein [Pseudomonas dryadis]